MCMICQSRAAMMDPETAERGISWVQAAGSLDELLRAATVNEFADAAGSTQTSATMQVGDIYRGLISSTFDEDWVRITLDAGQSYVFSVWGRDAFLGISDPYLELRGSNGALIASNDDAAPQWGNYFSLIEYTAQTSGTYYLSVSGSSLAGIGQGTGRYILQAATNVYTLDQIASYLTEFDWGLTAPLRLNVQTGGTVSVNLTGLTADGRQLARWAMEAWENATGLTFVETASSGAMIIFDDNQPGAVAGPGSYNPNTMIMSWADVNVGTGWLNSFGTTLDSYSFQTYVHEIGHALGLGHTGPYDGSASYGSSNIYLNDSTQVSIMSYFGAEENFNVTGDAVSIVTPMIADLIAVHSVYGTPQAYQGNTTWGANSNVGGYLGTLFSYIFDGVTPNSNIYTGQSIAWTVFDTGGTDTLDFSTVTAAQVIDMRPEGVSSVGGVSGNMVIARGTIIENAIGGAGNDLITGNSADNVIEGGAGNDTIHGGAGNDTAVLRVNFASVTATAIAGGGIRVVSSLGTDEYYSIESFRFNDGTYSADQVLNGNTPPASALIGTDGPDTLIGTDGRDSIEGRAGDDVLGGGAGDDTLLGGGGNDTIAASDGNDLVYGGDGDDSIGGGTGNDTVYGGAGNDIVGGGFGDDLIYGDDGDDGLFAGAGDDTVYGGDGNDNIGGGLGNDLINGDAGNDNLGGGAGRDTIFGGAGNDSIGGGEGDDLIYGDAGNDFLAGGGRNDTIYGGAGDDVINGGSGNDLMYGGAGRDVFVFNELIAGETDRIGDFEIGLDTIRLRGVGGGTQQQRFDALDITNVGGSAWIAYDGYTIILDDIAASSLSRSDFVFL